MTRIGDLGDAELDRQIQLLVEEKRQRMASSHDPDDLVHQAMTVSGFAPSGSPLQPQVRSGGITVMTGTVRETSRVRHSCTLYTVCTMPGEEECWFWDEDSPSYLTSVTSKVERIRRTAAVHALVPGSFITRHEMSWNGTRHERKESVSFELRLRADEVDPVLYRIGSTHRPLPAPPGQDGY